MHPQQVIAALHFAPLLPAGLLIVLGVLALGIVAFALWQRGRGALFRLAAFAMLLLWLAGPRLVRETRQPLGDIGLLVVDQSASMAIGDRAQLAETARRSIEAQASRHPNLQLRVITVPEAGSSGTRLFAAIDHALGDIPRNRFAGTIAITDGQITDVPRTTPGGAPFNLLLTAKGEQTDRRLRIIEAPTYGIVGKSVLLRIAVDDLGTSGGTGPATLTIRRDGKPFLTEPVPVGVPQNIRIPITRAGPTIIEMAASKLPGEISQLNNRAVVQINGVRDRLRVLLISGKPHQGERTWRRLLKSDPSVDLVHFTILRPPDKVDNTPLSQLALIPFPVRELFVDKINDFDLIILDRFQNEGLLPMDYLANIARRVRDGGALLMSVGPEFSGFQSLAYTPLASILPGLPASEDAVVNGEFRPVVTALGQRHPVTEGLPGANPPGANPPGANPPGGNPQNDPSQPPTWGPWYRRIQTGPVKGEVLLRAPGGAPLLALNRVGRGRVALLLSDQIWLWSRGHKGGGPQGELLRRIAHWLMREPELEENALTARITDGQLRIGSRSDAATPPLDVTVTDPSGRTQTLKLHIDGPGRASATLDARSPGVWHVTQGTRSAYAAADLADPPEYADLRATAGVAGPLAIASGGGIHWLGRDGVPRLHRTDPDRAASGAGWVGLQRRDAHIVTGVAALPLLPAWVSLPLILGLLLLGWRREGR